MPAVYHAAAIRSDLAELHGLDWSSVLPLLESGRRYAKRVEAAAKGEGLLLISHAYTRYMGDLSGGQVMQRRLAGSMGLPATAMSFYAFPRITEIDAFKIRYRAAIDRAGRRIAVREPILEEAAAAFTLNIELSIAVQAAGTARE